jgi:hypothetical protein
MRASRASPSDQRHRDPIGKGDAAEAKWFEQGRYACHQNGPGELSSLIADDGAALVTYPEYHTPNTLMALQESVDSGGTASPIWAATGSTGGSRPAPRSRMSSKSRRAEGGGRAGEYFQALDGGYGGLWRRNGRQPLILCGVGFSAQGLFEGSYYRRMTSGTGQRLSNGMPDGAAVVQAAAPGGKRSAAVPWQLRRTLAAGMGELNAKRR